MRKRSSLRLSLRVGSSSGGEQEPPSPQPSPTPSTSSSSTISSVRSSSVSLLTAPFRRMSQLRRNWFLEQDEGGDDEDSPTVAKAREIIADRSKRQALVNQLITMDTDYIEKIHFVACVHEYANTPGQLDRENKGRRLVTLFVGKDAKFPLQGIPPHTRHQLLHHEPSSALLVGLGDLFLHELVASQDFVDALLGV
ncbi:hypothetical protein BASA81_000875 [Batrachochytrium salamandrivorans]|nr:hypothetical protein BASA81_000875 [Batrachochytrium salamandrivorans]